MESALLLERLEDAERSLAEACEEIITLKAALAGAKETNDQLAQDLRFWRYAAENAVEHWNNVEDDLEHLKAQLRELAKGEDMPPETRQLEMDVVMFSTGEKP